MVCELCQSEETLFELKKEGLCKECQKYLVPTFLRKTARPILTLIEGGQKCDIKKRSKQ